MKKYIVLALLLIPVASFGAPSVRVLGNNAGTPAASGATAVKVTPAKTTLKAASDSSAARVGTLRAKSKTSGTVSTTGATSTSRFPVITPAHSYSSVTKPQPAATTTTVTPSNIDIDNYYTKEEVNNIVNALNQEEDPRVDMIHMGNQRASWMATHGARVNELENDGYVFMWIED